MSTGSVTTSSSPFAMPGLATGLDTSTIVSELMSIQQRPVVLMQNQQSAAQSRLDAYRTLNTKLMALQTSAKALMGVSQNLSPFSAMTATSSDDSIFTAKLNGTASPGSFSVKVNQLATSQVFRGGTFSGGVAGNVTIGTATIAITATDTVQDVADKINQDVNSPMNATVASGRLVLTNKTSGAAASVSITGGAALLTAVGLKSGTNGALNTNGKDAKITVNGIAETSSSNTFTNALTGVDITAVSVNATAGTVTVAADPTQTVNAVKDLVAKFNDIVSTINTDVAYDATAKKGGPLAGDAFAENLLTQLTRQITGAFDTSAQAASPTTGLRNYTDVGISVQRDGTLSLDSTKLTTALTNYSKQTNSSASVYQLFAWEDKKTNADGSLQNNYNGVAGNTTVSGGNTVAGWQAGWGDGLATRLSAFVDEMISPSSMYNAPSAGGRYAGGVLSHINSLNTQIANYSKEITSYNSRLDLYKAYLTKTFQQMESSVASIRNQGSYLSSQFAGLSGSSG